MSRYDDVHKVWDDRAFKAYSAFTDRPKRHVIRGALILVGVIALIVFAGWRIGWWFQVQDQTRTDKLYQLSYGNQSSLRSDITTQVATVLQDNVQIERSSGAAETGIKANRYQVVAIICNDAAQIVGGTLSAGQRQFVSTNCEAGAVKPGSPYSH